MVLAAPTIGSAVYFETIVNELYDQIEGLDPSGYAYDESDAWTRARVPMQWTAHLQTWVWLGQAVGNTPADWRYSGIVFTGLRYVPESDAHSQGVIFAAQRDLAVALQRFRCRLGRVISVGECDITPDSGAWFTLSQPFTLALSRR